MFIKPMKNYLKKYFLLRYYKFKEAIKMSFI